MNTDSVPDGTDLDVDSTGARVLRTAGALFREKLLFSACQLRRILIDPSKRVERLGASFPVPVEVVPRAAAVASAALKALGATGIVSRTGSGKDGPVLTEQGNLLLDCRFERIDSGLEAEIKQVTGVLDSGLFQGFAPEIIEA